MQPEILEVGVSPRKQDGKNCCYILHNNFLVADLDMREIEPCVANLAAGRIHQTSCMACFVLDDAFEMSVEEVSGDIYFKCGDVTYSERHGWRRQIIAEWLAPKLEELGYNQVSGGLPVPKSRHIQYGLLYFAVCAFMLFAMAMHSDFDAVVLKYGFAFLIIAAIIITAWTLNKLKQNLRQTVYCKGAKYAAMQNKH